MTEDRIRKWVRGELRGEPRREVSRWLVRCTDPRLPVLLQGMIREARDEAADQTLATRGRLWTRLVDAWGELLTGGMAGVATGLEPPLVLAADVPPPAAEALSCSLSPTRLATLRLPAGGEAGLYLTSDDGACLRLWGPATVTGAVTAAVPDTLGARATLWAVWADTLPRAAQPLEELTAALSQVGVVRSALRLEPGDV